VKEARPIMVRFFEKVNKTTHCWIWTGLTNKKGYGRFGVSRDRGMVLSHRFAWELLQGSIPDGMCVLHKCDNPPCVCPEHLFLGTRIDNNKDMEKKGRANYIAWKFMKPEHRARGERIAKTMTEESVRCLRREYAGGGTSFVKLGKKFGIGKTTVENIVRRKKWAHVQ